MNRWKAFLIHFAISLAVFAVLLAIILLIWYPGLMFALGGGWEGLRIVIGVDLVLGPLLTLIVFKEGKPSLKFDLSCIGIFQILCLSAGVWIVYNERPVVLAIEYDTVYSLTAREFSYYGNDMDDLTQFDGPFPKTVYIQLPENDQEAAFLSIEQQLNGEPLYGRAENYLPLSSDKGTARSLFRKEQMVRFNAHESIINQLGENCVFSKFVSVSSKGLVCFDLETLTITDFFEEVVETTE